MTRTMMLCALPLLFAGLLPAAPAPETQENVIRLTVSPMPAPRPALRYQLLPDLREIQQGQMVHNFFKCFSEQQHFFFHKDSMEKREKYLKLPLDELPVKELRDYGGHVLRQADYAARLDTVDWQMLPLLRRDGMLTLLSDLQQMRLLAATLAVRFRGEVADDRFDDGIRTAKTMFALGRSMSEHPTLIGHLVGAAICQVTINPLDEMIGRPGSPNLYWALTNLPSPMIDIRKGIQGEKFMLGVELEPLDDPEPKTDKELKKLMAKITEVLKYADGPKVDPATYLPPRVADEAHLKAARQRLIQGGFDAKKINACFPLQVVLMDEKLTYLAELDDQCKAILLPYPEMERVLAGVPTKKDDEGLFLCLVPMALRVRVAQSRLDQRIALLRVVEALRLHAAEKGEFPAKLSDVNVPVPVDPIIGKPFEYVRESGRVSLRGAPTPVGKDHSRYQVRYELTLRK